jgi:integrase/recombinase XerD
MHLIQNPKLKRITTISLACDRVEGFIELNCKLEQTISITGRSHSTYRNYALHLAKVALYFGSLPTRLTIDQINEYLYIVKEQHKSISDSYFKFTVYGLRFVFRMEGLTDKLIKLPSIKHDKKLPTVLSRQEVRRLLIAPKRLKHRVLLALLYGCGLRCFELRGLKLEDLDFDRKVLHVRMGKGRKDRYVPLCDLLIRGLKKYIANENPQNWLFNGKFGEMSERRLAGQYSRRGVIWVVKKAREIAGISKHINVHTLRHTFATHLLEDGLDIVSIKNLLGHVRIETTMVYLHVAQSGYVKPFSPLESLYYGKPSVAAIYC